MSPWCTEESASSMSELPLSSRPASSSEQKQTYLRNLEERIAEESDILEDIHLEAAIDAQLIFPSEEGAKSKHRPNTDNRPLFDDYENPNAVSNCLSPYVPSKATSIAAFLELVGSLKGGSDASDAPLHAEDVLLDIGCGDGRVCIGVSKLTRCRSIGIDVSPVCIERAKVIAAEEGVDDLCTFLQADATIAVDRLMEGTRGESTCVCEQQDVCSMPSQKLVCCVL